MKKSVKLLATAVLLAGVCAGSAYASVLTDQLDTGTSVPLPSSSPASSSPSSPSGSYPSSSPSASLPSSSPQGQTGRRGAMHAVGQDDSGSHSHRKHH